ncbi:methyltransferase [Sodalis-like endosymbiont of Proechinophthirus fluctus]|uniref:methyltransferase n=1 Tax=Sodalis-like endosymbiont of Proechinophthirus fluctus TaxID=1462730 RepID=UPI001FCC11AE|nr:methyltransferase [Sodalis-like endosymbiont of Proechinophthirus fluctus]
MCNVKSAPMVCCWTLGHFCHRVGQRALDISTGSGLVALIMAKHVHGAIPIDAIELDPDACRQARDNFTASPWAMSLCTVEAISASMLARVSRRYKAIVSDLPYFDVGPA